MNRSKILYALVLMGSACTAYATRFVMTTDVLVSLSMSDTQGHEFFLQERQECAGRQAGRRIVCGQ